MTLKPVSLPLAEARRLWLRAQRLDTREPFGSGPEATHRAVEHLGYVQIDTINVVERSHHHILFTRIPAYRRSDLHQAQTIDKSVFEYWTHALAYVPTRDLPFFILDMKEHRIAPSQWYADGDPKDLARMKRQIRRDGAISIRDIKEEPVEKVHLWASRKPSKRVLQHGFYNGDFTISERTGMLKTYELMDRHFGWTRPPRAATAAQVREYLLERALRSQGLVSAASTMYPRLRFPPELIALIGRRVRRKTLVPVTIADDPTPHWITPEALDEKPGASEPLVHILSPFDPVVIQRRRLSLFFGYDHVFEAYVPKAKRKFGYFTLPVLYGDAIVAALDLKADRVARKLLIQSWTWLGEGRPRTHKKPIEAELDRFAAFQFGD
jgi:uncharacterized protein YcaQ